MGDGSSQSQFVLECMMINPNNYIWNAEFFDQKRRKIGQNSKILLLPS